MNEDSKKDGKIFNPLTGKIVDLMAAVQPIKFDDCEADIDNAPIKFKPCINLAPSLGIPPSLLAAESQFSGGSAMESAAAHFKSVVSSKLASMRAAIDANFSLYYEASAINDSLPADLQSRPGARNELACRLAVAAREFEAALILTGAAKTAAHRAKSRATRRYAVCWRYVDYRGRLVSGIHCPTEGLPFAIAYNIQRWMTWRMFAGGKPNAKSVSGRVWLQAVE